MSFLHLTSLIFSLLGNVYCLVLILLGLMFSLADALQANWLQTYYTGTFLVYIYTTATVMLLVLQLYIIPASMKKNESESKVKYSMHFPPTNGLSQVDPNILISSNSINRMLNTSTVSIGRDLNESDVRSNNGPDTNNNNTNKNRNPFVAAQNGAAENEESRPRTISSFSPHWVEGQHVREHHKVDHSGSSFYLRIGLLVFGMGHMIYVIMEVDYRLIGVPDGCQTERFSWTFILRLLFLAVQTFFLFKNPTVNITKLRSFSEFSFKHLISTNIIVWLRTLMSEIEEALLHSHALHKDDNHNDTLNDSCSEDWEIIAKVRPYLFPFVLEYSLIAVGISGILCSKVFHHKLHDHIYKHLTRHHQRHKDHATASSVEEADSVTSDMISETESEESEAFGPMHHKQHHTTVTFRSSNKGLLLGACVFCVTVVSVIIFFFDLTGQDFSSAQKNFLITDMSLHVLMLIASIMGLWSLSSLPLKEITFTQVDDVLLFVAMAGSILFEISLVISCSVYLNSHDSSREDFLINSLALTSAILSCVQTLLQTVLIELGLRKYCSTSKQQEEMKGREAITFLIVCNVTVWIFRTMQVKEIEMGIQEEFYGVLAWLLIMNISLPFLLFFYFHSSICLADIWIEAYHFDPSVHGLNNETEEAAANGMQVDYKSESILSYINSSFIVPTEENERPSNVIDITHM